MRAVVQVESAHVAVLSPGRRMVHKPPHDPSHPAQHRSIRSGAKRVDAPGLRRRPPLTETQADRESLVVPGRTWCAAGRRAVGRSLQTRVLTEPVTRGPLGRTPAHRLRSSRQGGTHGRLSNGHRASGWLVPHRRHLHRRLRRLQMDSLEKVGGGLSCRLHHPLPSESLPLAAHDLAPPSVKQAAPLPIHRAGR